MSSCCIDDCRRLRACVVVVIVVQRVVVSSQHDVSVFVVMVRCLFMFGQFKRVKYIQSKTINQINSRQYVVELESYVL